MGRTPRRRAVAEFDQSLETTNHLTNDCLFAPEAHKCFACQVGTRDGRRHFGRSVLHHRRPILKFARMDHEPTEFVSDSDTHHLLYISALKPGWYCVG